jgi:hypothetical protein
MTSKHTSHQEWVAKARAVRIEHEIARRGIKLRKQGAEYVGPCPQCGGDDRFAVNIVKQAFNCRGCGAKGNVIALVMHIDGVDFRYAVATLTGEQADERRRAASISTEITRQFRRHDNGEDERRNLDLADEIWRATQPLTPEAIDYFNRRGIDIDMVPEHGGLRFDRRHQCIVGRFTTAISNARHLAAADKRRQAEIARADGRVRHSAVAG